MILDTGAIAQVTHKFVPSTPGDTLVTCDGNMIYKTVECGVTRTIDSRVFTDLVVVKFITDRDEYGYDRNPYMEYIFSRERGLFGCGVGVLMPIEGDTIRIVDYSFFLDPIQDNDSLIFDMTF